MKRILVFGIALGLGILSFTDPADAGHRRRHRRGGCGGCGGSYAPAYYGKGGGNSPVQYDGKSGGYSDPSASDVPAPPAPPPPPAPRAT